MDKETIEYLEKQKANFNNDGWWGKTSKELANGDIHQIWLKLGSTKIKFLTPLVLTQLVPRIVGTISELKNEINCT